MKYFQIAVAICLLAITVAVVTGQSDTPIKVRSCPGEKPTALLTGVYIENCIKEPCIFKKGGNYSMEMDLEILGSVEKLEARLYAIVAGVPIKWEGVNPEGCRDIISAGPRCPLSKGDYISYGVNLHVGSLFPSVTADVKYMLMDEKEETQICWMVKASVQSA